MSDLGSLKWDLKIDKQIAWNVGYGTSGLFRFLKAFEINKVSNTVTMPNANANKLISPVEKPISIPKQAPTLEPLLTPSISGETNLLLNML